MEQTDVLRLAGSWVLKNTRRLDDSAFDAALRDQAKLLNSAIEAGDWQRFLGLCDRPDRWRAFRKAARSMSDTEYWQSLSYVLQDTETLWRQRDLGKLLRARKRGDRQAIMNDDELARLADLEDVLTVYRGCQEHNRDGWSWTLSRKVAERFALRFNDSGLVLCGTVERSRIVAVFLGEDEVLCDPKDVGILADHSITSERDAQPA